jgi:hypothetical protein
VLYDQMDNGDGIGSVSQDFETANDAFDAQIADDFVVPAGQTWTVTGVDAGGVYFNGPGPAANFNVYFYSNAGTLPGAVFDTRLASPFTDAGAGSPVITFATPVTLPAGTYWVSIQARLDFTPGGEWGWNNRSVGSNSPAAFQNPGDGFATGCTTWGARNVCLVGDTVPDQMFRINGTSSTGGGGSFPPDENFEEVTVPALPTGFVSTATGAGVNWVTENTVSDTAPNAAHASDFPAVSDMTLDTPSFTAAAGQTVSFHHSFNLENTFDGAVLEISINGGAFQDIIAAGGTIDSGGYTGTISSSFGSPISGRAAWTGNSGGFITTSATLPAAAAGQPTVLRFRTADDSSVAPAAPNGWWVDTIHLGTAAVPPIADVTPATLDFTVAAGGSTASPLNIANIGGGTLNWAATEATASQIHPRGDVLYDQFDNDSGSGSVSQDFEAANDGFDAQAADDFIVPSGATWTLTQVDVAGVYFNGPGPADSFNVTFYSDAAGLPGAAVATLTGQTYTNGASAMITLSTPVVLTQGTYWVSVQARLDFTPGGEWGWEDRSVQANTGGVWQNPGDGFASGCTTWTTLLTCIPTAGGNDRVFRLHGTSGGGGGGGCTNPSDVPWLSEAPTSGAVAGGSSQDSTVTVNASSLAPGSYSAHVCVATDDPTHALVDVPVSVTVTTGGAGTFPPDENFDEVTAPALPTGWTTAASGAGVPWVTDATVSDTAPNSAHAPDFPSVSDMTLDSPSFTPLGATTLTFRHSFNLENTFDGAVLEISIGGGAFTDIITAGGTFESGGYIGPISSSFGSPISGRQAWTGNSAGFITTVVDLPPSATGLLTVLRFRTADDSSVAPTAPNGWWIDTLHLSVSTLPSVTKSFTPASVQVSTDSTATITLGNPTTGPATLTANLVDTLPAGLVATAGSAATTCAGGAGASNTSSSITLGSGAVIPASGSCTVTATVHSDTAGSYVNTIPVGAVQTDIGNNDTAASATLTVTPLVTPPVAVVTPSSLSFTQAAGTSGSDPLNIANTGGSNLSFTITEGTTAIHRPTSYKTVSRTMQERLAKFGPASMVRNLRAGDSATGQPRPLGSQDISQMADNTPGDQGVSCGVSGVSTADNSWWRRFYFSEHAGVGASTAVSSVTISSGSTGPNGLPISINLYTVPHGDPVDTIPLADLTPIGSGTGTIDSGLVSVTIPVSGAVADTANLDLVVEYHTDGTDAGQFFPGANATTETHPTFLSSSTCGVTDPTTAADLGFPDFHLTMIVTLGGTPPPTCANQADVPWLSEAPTSGTVVPGGNTDVTVTANAAGLTPGTYNANVCVGSNDPVNPLITVPVTLTVTPGVFVPCSGGADEIFCDGFELPGGGGPQVFTDRTSFVAAIAAGYYENPFDDAVPGPSPPLNYTNGGWAYTVDASSPGPDGGLYNDTGLISTNLAADSIVVTFTGDPVSGVGGNFWATDISVQPTGTDVTITLSDGTTETFTSTGPSDFRGFTTAAPITSITIDAPDTGGTPYWPTMDNLIVGSAN